MHSCGGMTAGKQQLLKAEGYHFLFSKTRVAIVIYYAVTHHSWLKGGVASEWGELNAVSSSTLWINHHKIKHMTPIFLMRMTNASVPSQSQCQEVYFLFYLIFNKCGDINGAKYVVCNLGEWLCHISKLLAKLRGSKLFEKPIDGEWDAGWRITALVTNRMNVSPTLPFSFTNALHPEWVISRLTPEQPHLFVLQHLKCKVVHLTTLQKQSDKRPHIPLTQQNDWMQT